MTTRTASAFNENRGTVPSRRRGRSESVHAAIIAAATSEFSHHGFELTTMDRVAEVASVSKRTVYDHFGDKERLFAAVIADVGERAEAITTAIAHQFEHVGSDPHDLEELAVSYAAAVTRPEVIRLRRLAIREAERFPAQAATYYDRAPRAALTALAAGFADMAERGLLLVDDPSEAAAEFAYLILGLPVDHALFFPDAPLTPDEVERHARAGARTFLEAHGIRYH